MGTAEMGRHISVHMAVHTEWATVLMFLCPLTWEAVSLGGEGSPNPLWPLTSAQALQLLAFSVEMRGRGQHARQCSFIFFSSTHFSFFFSFFPAKHWIFCYSKHVGLLEAYLPWLFTNSHLRLRIKFKNWTPKLLNTIENMYKILYMYKIL